MVQYLSLSPGRHSEGAHSTVGAGWLIGDAAHSQTILIFQISGILQQYNYENSFTCSQRMNSKEKCLKRHWAHCHWLRQLSDGLQTISRLCTGRGKMLLLLTHLLTTSLHLLATSSLVGMAFRAIEICLVVTHLQNYTRDFVLRVY